MAHQEGGHLVFLVELPHQLEAAAEVDPRVVLAGIEAERQRRIEGEGRILADVIVGCRVPALDRLVLDGIDDLQTRNDLAGRKDANLELVVGKGRDALGEELAGAIDRVERLGEARRHAPLHLGHRLGNRRSGQDASGGDRRTANSSRANEFATLHLEYLPKDCCLWTRIPLREHPEW